ncbi:MAG: SET domain-containing protein-lysine N-methyltransferase [Candidatus Hodarchaeota archaeon]
MKYQSYVNTCSYGKCLVAANNISSNCVVEKIEGYTINREEIPQEEIYHAILIARDKWMVIQTNARYINHSCSPNCYINDDLEVITKVDVKKGEELTIAYNIVRTGEDPGQWDERWSFRCLCGSRNCQGIIDKYITEDGLPYNPNLNQSFEKVQITTSENSVKSAFNTTLEVE